ncbi:DUF397 domain-containing protein [Micromonospora sp. WMMD1082]|uniref:DUF397 domain-containing protein n=1 Tax=Micromonospora sp. WMMD1082 TaxID=3016104 RepID=UPI0024161209|nr:DUF397 domain-containing protein [Micromonospora sp. WMMD1082]MDG4795971.1 DUF397 domain-containing protein [Micromonospora sp. WMMD1082]
MSNMTGAEWRKSSYSANEGNCVEVADNTPSVVGVRDSKDIAGPALMFAPEQWRSFITSIKAS